MNLDGRACILVLQLGTKGDVRDAEVALGNEGLDTVLTRLNLETPVTRVE